MPRFSAFTPFGLFRFSAKRSDGEGVYRSLLGSLGGNYDVSPGSRMDGWCYATALAIARARLVMIHAGLQTSPKYVAELLSQREAEYQIIPGPFDTVAQRRAVLAARAKLPRGARREAVEDGLRTMLGDAFVWYYTTKPADIATWPTALGDQPQNLQRPSIPRKRVTITQAITTGLGAPQSVSYTLAEGAQGNLLVGDDLVVQPDNVVRAETVTVDAVTPTHFTATFNNVHDLNCVGTTMSWPAWVSNQRFDLVVVSAAAAIDPETRRKTSDLLERVLRAVSTWGIVAETSPGSGTAGPFIIGTSPIGATPFGTITFP